MMEIKNFINGVFVDSVSNEVLENINPATGKKYSTLPKSVAADVQNAIDAAQSAFAGWSQLEPRERGHFLRAIALEIQNNLEVVGHC
ncbi:MAG: aldehyde dehydrogenase family protein [Bdellovibrionales bacterium]